METPTKLDVSDQANLDTQEIKIGDQGPNCMNDTLVVIKTHEANIEDHELDVMNDQAILDTQEVKTTNQEPNLLVFRACLSWFALH